ncbi:Mitochondrial carrier family protein [Babesia bovis T2Bo]|uniref:Mitochondrial carrier protein, putative n=1 Tax=Babesia bovis TaxID=5865 RepID=A7ANW4_BABBO|nr:Mitochondrial carrier family protein [Babesia bovis T2Bo]EDO08248.1 Mitochondrial carrier family protein [Babesia bovis T2Bo]|eukprot:XP_001611816.1 mitochondrial carrier protein [Babesia bovis T2Bo]
MPNDEGTVCPLTPTKGHITVDYLKSHATVTALSNALAGAMCTLITQPIASLRTRLQSLNIYCHGVPKDARSKLKALYKVSMRDGFFSLYRGGGCSMVISAAGWFIFRFTYDELTQRKVVEFDSKMGNKLILGSLSSLVTTVILHPAWNAKLNIELQTSKTKLDGWPQYRGTMHYLFVTTRDQGIKGLYKGWEVNGIGVIYYGMVICLYETLSESDWEQYPILHKFKSIKPMMNGMLSKIIPTTLCYPFYVSRTMQICFATELTHRKLHEIFFWTLKHKRLSGLYAGFQMQLIKSLVSGGITFGIYEAILIAIAKIYNLAAV